MHVAEGILVRGGDVTTYRAGGGGGGSNTSSFLSSSPLPLRPTDLHHALPISPLHSPKLSVSTSCLLLSGSPLCSCTMYTYIFCTYTVCLSFVLLNNCISPVSLELPFQSSLFLYRFLTICISSCLFVIVYLTGLAQTFIFFSLDSGIFVTKPSLV
jgi:hypothetical protein